MGDEIKVGDVCEVLRGGYYFPAGVEVTVISGPRMYPFVPPTEVSFEIEDASGVRCWAYRSTLRKKRPPAESAQVIRQETVPREQFERWLERVREKRTENA